MIPTLIILLLFSGGFGAKDLDLSDPVVLAEFSQNVSKIISDPSRAANVTNAVHDLNVMSSNTRSANGTAEQEIVDFRTVAGNYNASRAEVHAALGELENSLLVMHRSTIAGREIIRQNTTKKEWKKLVKELAK